MKTRSALPQAALAREALAVAGRGKVEGLPLDPALYSQTALAQTARAFSGSCVVETRTAPDVRERHIDITIPREHLSQGTDLIGEFLNHLLVLAFRENCAEGSEP